jgi:hypothetical protein
MSILPARDNVRQDGIELTVMVRRAGMLDDMRCDT